MANSVIGTLSTVPTWAWIVFTLLAAAGQSARNALQKSLTEKLGTAGATHVRFLYGLPFGLLILALYAIGFAVFGQAQAFLQTSPSYFAWILLGAGAQMFATALMLAAMKSKSLVITTALIKTEPVQVAIFAAIFLSEYLSGALWVAVIVATLGVLIMSWPKKEGLSATSVGSEQDEHGRKESQRAIVLGLVSGGLFALSAVGFRGAVLALQEPNPDAHFLWRASFTVLVGLAFQACVLTVYLLWKKPDILRKLAQLWRPSLLGGFMGAFASNMWYAAFALATVAQVRTLGLAEIFFALFISKKFFAQATQSKELIGMVLIALGVAGVTLLK